MIVIFKKNIVFVQKLSLFAASFTKLITLFRFISPIYIDAISPITIKCKTKAKNYLL
jgi:hypothetical protein